MIADREIPSEASKPIIRALFREGRSLQFLLWACVLAVFSLPSYGADPFYVSLMRDGIDSFDRGEHQRAAESLRLANFGFLDEPSLLAEGLVRYSLTQIKIGNQEGFRGSFRRILEIEERFGAYTASQMPLSLRKSFETAAKDLIPESLLSAVPSFQPLARQRAADRITALPKAQRREALQAKIDDDPAEPLWRLELAQLTLDNGSPQEALGYLSSILEKDPDDAWARCLQGEALALVHRCTRGLSDLQECPEAKTQARFALPLIQCQITLENWPGADQALAVLDPSLRSQRDFVRLGRRIQRGLRQQGASKTKVTKGSAPSAGAAGTADATKESPTTAVRTRPPTAPRSRPVSGSSEGGVTASSRDRSQSSKRTTSTPRRPITTEEKNKLDEARRLLSDARRSADLLPALALARSVADSHPESRKAQHLVAEISYRASRWREAAAYFRRGGDPGNDRPNLLFFMAIAFYESGDAAGARGALQRSLPKLQRTEFVDAYVHKILGGSR